MLLLLLLITLTATVTAEQGEEGAWETNQALVGFPLVPATSITRVFLGSLSQVMAVRAQSQALACVDL